MVGDEVRDDLRGAPLFADLDPGIVDRLARGARRVQIGEGTALFREGERADRWWLIHEGRVALEINTPDGGAIVIATLGPGQAVGWSWLLPPYRWHLDARVLGDVTASEWDATTLRAQCDADPLLGYELMRRFAQITVERLQATRLQLLDLYGTNTETHRGFRSEMGASGDVG